MTMNEILSKQALRRLVKDRKNAVPQEERAALSVLGTAALLRHPAWQAAQTVCLYWSLPDEVQTHALCRQAALEKTVLLPVVRGDDLVLRRFTGDDCLSSDNAFHIGEPTGEDWQDLEHIDLVLVPGVAFDSQHHRMGRGRGFYDRMLPGIPAFKMGICFDFQLFDTIPTDPFDVPVDDLIVCSRNSDNL